MNQPSIMYTEVVFGLNFQAVVEILMSAFLATPGAFVALGLILGRKA